MRVSKLSASNTNVFLALMLVLGGVGYVLPWASGTATALTFSAYDLAEWTSLIPGIRYGADPMAVPGYLRAFLVVLTVIIVLLPARRFSYGGAAAVLTAIALVVAQLPPFEYFLDAGFRTDVNYGQQVSFALMALIGALASFAVPRGNAANVALVVAGGVGSLVVMIASSRAHEALSGLHISIAVGIGPWISAAACAGIAGLAVVQLLVQKSQGAH